MIRFVLLSLIRAYQLLMSPLKVSSCRFYPTCSQYMYEAIQQYGTLRGAVMGVKRLARCHPFNPGGYDPVIEASSPASSKQMECF
jgi:putative membrane protein insertion efficiency factor